MVPEANRQHENCGRLANGIIIDIRKAASIASSLPGCQVGKQGEERQRHLFGKFADRRPKGGYPMRRATLFFDLPDRHPAHIKCFAEPLNEKSQVLLEWNVL